MKMTQIIISIFLKFRWSIILSLFCSNFSIGQFKINFRKNIDFYKPYTVLAQEYLSENSNSVTSSTYNWNMTFSHIKLKKAVFNFGISFQYIQHVVSDKLLYYGWWNTVYQEDYYAYEYYPRDLTSRSYCVGLTSDYNRLIFKKGKMNMSYGVSMELYLFEFFDSDYHFERSIDGQGLIFYPINSGELRIFKPSYLNTSVFYLHTWQLAPAFSLGARISMGTNLYSDWDQFKRYAWVGVGLEMGFGKGKEEKRDLRGGK